MTSSTRGFAGREPTQVSNARGAYNPLEGVLRTSNYWLNKQVSRRRALRGAGIGVAGLAGAALVGCGGDDEPSATGTPAGSATAAGGSGSATATMDDASAPKSGGELILAGGDLQKLDFQATISTPTQYASSLVFSRLVRYDPHTALNDYGIIPDLAESWEVSEDQIVFHLKPGVKWQNLDPMNGRELTAEDIKYSLERVGTDDAEYVHAYKVGPIASIDAPDASTVVLNLARPSASLLFDLGSGQGMGTVPREVIEADGDLNTRWVGTGPFMLDTWEQGTRIRFLKNPDYHLNGQPYVDSVEWRFIRDASTNLANFLADQLHFYIAPSLEQANQIRESTDATVTPYVHLGGTHKVPNVGPSGPEALRDVRVRRAIDIGIDRELILDLVLGGDGVYAGPPLPQTYGKWSLPDDEVAEAYKMNLEEARKLLDASGFNDLKLVNRYSNTSTFSEDESPLMQQTLAEIGIDLQLEPVERTVYLQSQVDHDFELMSIGMGAYPDPDNYLFPTFHSAGTKNYGQVNDPDLDARIEESQGILDEEERVEFIHNLQRDWPDYLYRTYSVNPYNHYAWNSAVTGTFTPKGWDYQGLQGVSFV